MKLDLSVGDIVLGGKFRNKPYVVKSFDEDEHGQPVIVTDKGKIVKLLAVRIKKLIPQVKEEKSLSIMRICNEILKHKGE